MSCLKEEPKTEMFQNVGDCVNSDCPYGSVLSVTQKHRHYGDAGLKQPNCLHVES